MSYFYGAPGTQFPSGNDSVHDPHADLLKDMAALALGRASAAGAAGVPEAESGVPSWLSIAAAGIMPTLDPDSVPSWEPAYASAPPPPPPPPPAGADDRPMCTFFAAGRCRHGDACRFRHSEVSEAAIVFFVAAMKRANDEAAATAAASRSAGGAAVAVSSGLAQSPAAAAAAPRADSVAGAVDDADFAAACERWQTNALAAKDALIAAALETGVVPSEEAGETALQLAERRLSAEMQCGVCMEPIAATASRRFGLLTGCTHTFCLDCIREWRARIDLPKATVRACPQCRALSYTVVPCDRYVADPVRKAGISAAYHRQQGKIPCRFFDGGRGDCPFGSSCWYSHIRPDGSVHVYAKPALRLNADGPTGPSRNFKLSEFL